MKFFSLAILFAFISVSAFSQTYLPDFNFSLTDVASRGQTPDSLFQLMNRKIVKAGSSICSNRALIWTYDMKRFHNIDAGKVFLFYTGKNGEVGSKKWWYHVAPVVNQNGQAWVIDGGFPGFIRKPLTISEWLMKFVNTANCKMINSKERDLFELMHKGRMYPEYTPQYGSVDCYTYIAPGPFWTPATVAKGVLQEDADGTPIRFTRDEYNVPELMEACRETAAGRLGSIFGGQGKKCKEYLGVY